MQQAILAPGRASELARSVPTACPFSGLSFKVCLGTLAPGYYLVTAYNNPGQWTLDARYWTVKWPGAGAGAELRYQWQAKYRWRPEFQFGLQGFGELGPWRDWSPRQSQSHRAGPVLFGSLPLAEEPQWLYQAAYLLGSINARKGNMFSLRLRRVF